MKLLRKAWYPIPVTLILGLFGCTAHPTASDPSQQTSSGNFFDRAAAPGRAALEWREPLGQEIVVHQVIGPAGGVIELLGTGIEIRFPEGAISETVMIDARALEGSVVAFEFGAPGLTLGTPIEIRIDVEGLTGSWWELVGVYPEGSTSEVTPLEIFPIIEDGGSILFEISQKEIDFCNCAFFGFAVASG